MWFYEGVVRLGGSLPGGQGAGALGPSPPVYDIDPVAAYLSSYVTVVPPGNSTRFVRWTTYTTCTPAGAFGPFADCCHARDVAYVCVLCPV